MNSRAGWGKGIFKSTFVALLVILTMVVTYIVPAQTIFAIDYGTPDGLEQPDDTDDQTVPENDDPGIVEASAFDEFVTMDAGKYTVSFINNGSEFTAIDVDAGNTVSDPGAPDAADWPDGMLSFSGWFENSATERFDFTQPITGDLDLFARYDSRYMVKFKDGDGLVVDTIMVNKGAVIPQTTKIIAPPGGGYRLLYWYVEGGDSTEAFAFGSITATANITLVPHFSNTYTVVFISEGTQVPAAAVISGEKAVKPADPKRTGWEFAGWTLKDSTPYDFNEPVEKDLILYTSWTAKVVEYTVALWMEIPNYAGGDPDAKPVPGDISSYNYVGSVTLTGTAGEMTDLAELTLPQEIVDLFEGTSSDPTDLLRYAEFQSANNKIIQGNGSTVVNLYANRKVYIYEFRLEDDTEKDCTMTILGDKTYYSGEDEPGYELKVKYEMDISGKFPVQGVAFVIFNNTDGTSFNSWHRPIEMLWKDANLIASRRNVVDKGMISKDGQTLKYKLTAYWGTGSDVYNYRYLVEVHAGQAPTPQNSIVLELDGKTYIVMDEYSQNFQGNLGQKNINGLEMVDTYWELIGENSSVIAGYDWRPYSYTDQDGFQFEDGERGVEYFRCFFYTRIEYTLTFKGNPPANAEEDVKNVPAGRTIGYGAPVGAIPAAPSLEGYNFVEWYRDAELKEVFDFGLPMPNSNLTAYAKWESTDHTVTFKDGTGGNIVATQGVEKSGYIDFDAPSLWQKGDPVSGKGQFNGWYWFVEEIFVEYNPSIPVNGNYTLYASWLTNGFVVTYDANGGTGIAPVDGDEYSVGVQAPVLSGSGLEKGGKFFAGWTAGTGPHVYYPGNTIEMNGNVAFTARYLAKDESYTIRYIANYTGGEGEEITFQFPKDEDLTLGGKNIFNRSGHEIKYWTETQADDPVSNYPPSSMLTKDDLAGLAIGGVITLYAQWDKSLLEEFTVTVNGSYVTPPAVSGEGQYFEGEPVTINAGSRNGYTFNGWVTDQGSVAFADASAAITTFTMPKENVTVTAQWVYSATVRIYVQAATKVYDGTKFTATFNQSGLPGEYTLTVDEFDCDIPGREIINVLDSRLVGITGYSIKDSSGADVTASFTDVRIYRGLLVITPRIVTLTSASKVWEYDGVQHSEPVLLTPGRQGFVSGEGATGVFYNTSVITDPGSVLNRFYYTLDSGTRASNYIITRNFGTLEVISNQALIVITAKSDSKVYDGSALTNSNFSTSALPLGVTHVTAAVSGSQTQIGSSANVITAFTLWNGTKDVTAWFSNFRLVPGTLTVTSGGGGQPPTPPPVIIVRTVTPPEPEPDPIEPPAVIEDSPTPKAEPEPEPVKPIQVEPVPVTSFAGWALLNLLLTIVTAIIMAALLVTYFSKRRDDENEEYRNREEEKVKKHLAPRLLTVATTAVAIILFAMTQDMSLPMIMVDKWTIIYAIITAVTVVLAFFSRKTYEEDEGFEFS